MQLEEMRNPKKYITQIMKSRLFIVKGKLFDKQRTSLGDGKKYKWKHMNKIIH